MMELNYDHECYFKPLYRNDKAKILDHSFSMGYVAISMITNLGIPVVSSFGSVAYRVGERYHTAIRATSLGRPSESACVGGGFET